MADKTRSKTPPDDNAHPGASAPHTEPHSLLEEGDSLDLDELDGLLEDLPAEDFPSSSTGVAHVPFPLPPVRAIFRRPASRPIPSICASC